MLRGPGTAGPGPRPGPTRSSPPTAHELTARWTEELHALGYPATDRTGPAGWGGRGAGPARLVVDGW